MIRRTRLGSTYTKSPAQEVKETFESNFSKILFTFFICIAYLVILYVFVGVLKFLGSEIGTIWEKDMPVSKLYNHPACLPFKVGGILGIIIYVFRDKLTNR
jgi:hypothetical protein